MGEGRGVHWVLMGRPGGKRPLGRPRRRWEDNIKNEIGGACGSYGGGEKCARGSGGKI
jgi:hypothetical protein